jgi:hypothetical protein
VIVSIEVEAEVMCTYEELNRVESCNEAPKIGVEWRYAMV